MPGRSKVFWAPMAARLRLHPNCSRFAVREYKWSLAWLTWHGLIYLANDRNVNGVWRGIAEMAFCLNSGDPDACPVRLGKCLAEVDIR